MAKITMTVNGVKQSADVEDRTLLANFLRDTLKLTGTHVGCDTSQCGACTVHVDGRAVKSCTMLVAQADGPWAVDLAKPGPLDAKEQNGKALALTRIAAQNQKAGTPAFDTSSKYALGFALVTAAEGAIAVNLDAVAHELDASGQKPLSLLPSLSSPPPPPPPLDSSEESASIETPLWSPRRHWCPR